MALVGFAWIADLLKRPKHLRPKTTHCDTQEDCVFGRIKCRDRFYYPGLWAHAFSLFSDFRTLDNKSKNVLHLVKRRNKQEISISSLEVIVIILSVGTPHMSLQVLGEGWI